MSKTDAKSSSPGTILREPMLHFLVLAICLFGIYGFSRLGDGELLEISRQEIDARIFLQELAMDRELTAAEREEMTSLYIEEQVLVREALKLELDNDARIHDMLAQKMRHVLSGDVIQPGMAELRAYYEVNQDRYITAETVSVDELVFDNREELASEISGLLAAGGDAEAMLAIEPGTISPLPRVNRFDLANIFSYDFSDQVFAAPMNEWTGPFVSNRGQHWLRIGERAEAVLPDFGEIVDRVRFDWIATEEDRHLQVEVDRLRDDYVIVIND